MLKAEAQGSVGWSPRSLIELLSVTMLEESMHGVDSSCRFCLGETGKYPFCFLIYAADGEDLDLWPRAVSLHRRAECEALACT